MSSKVWQSNVKGNGARGGGAENGGESVMDRWRKGDGKVERQDVRGSTRSDAAPGWG